MLKLEKLLNNISLNKRILSLTFIPIILLIMLVGLNAYQSFQKYQDNEKILGLTSLSTYIGEVIHELQKERGQSAGFISSNGTKSFKESLFSQRRNVDSELTVLESHFNKIRYEDFSAEFEQKINRARDRLNNITNTRRSVVALGLTTGQMAKWYSLTISSLLDITKMMTGLGTDSQINQQVLSYVALMEIKENAGLERAMGTTGFSKGNFTPSIYDKFLTLIAKQDAFLTTFQAYANADFKQIYLRNIQGAAVKKIDEMRAIIIDTRGHVSDSGYSGQDWFKVSTQKIALYKNTEDDLNRLINDNAQINATDLFSKLVFMGLLSAVSIVALVFISIKVAQSISSPLTQLNASMQELVDGNLSVNVPCVDYNCEIGDMALSVEEFKTSYIERRRLREEAREAEQERLLLEDEKRRAEEESKELERIRAQEKSDERKARNESINDLITEFEQKVTHILSSLFSSSAEMSETSKKMVTTSNNTKHQSSTVASSSRQISNNIQTVAAAAEELTSSVQEISRQVHIANGIAEDAILEANQSNQAIQELAESASKVTQVTSLINDIAEQTNLLALNATIEAARAGDAGRGFAVVASEVKALAGQTANATNEISLQIEEIQSLTLRAVKSIENIVLVNKKSDETLTSISAAVEQQSSATIEISNNIQMVAVGTEEVSSNITHVANDADETEKAGKQVLSVSDKLEKISKKLKGEVDSFLLNVRNVDKKHTV